MMQSAMARLDDSTSELSASHAGKNSTVRYFVPLAAVLLQVWLSCVLAVEG